MCVDGWVVVGVCVGEWVWVWVMRAHVCRTRPLQVRRRLLQDRRPLQLLAALTPGRPRAAPAGPGPPCAEPITTPPVSRRARFRAAGRDRHRVEARRAWSDRVVGIQSESGPPPEPSPSHLSASSFRATFSIPSHLSESCLRAQLPVASARTRSGSSAAACFGPVPRPGRRGRRPESGQYMILIGIEHESGARVTETRTRNLKLRRDAIVARRRGSSYPVTSSG